MPSDTTIVRWLEEKPEFRVQYEDAYKIQMHLVFGEIKDIVDECEVADIAKVREQISVRKWLLKIHEPKKYGDRPEPADAPAPTRDLSNLTDEELDLFVKLLAKTTPNV